ncbi:hypothetical protein H6P81_000967 [Aristolochia fimbriata]|uniref:NAC domain-containing protein n=1 Tax=Aristolochia fimbriata TaxID=158543 RepID=A0AAV7F773_ARIFI|nr:hypothetical protein H6P81_000967 [Aristolochia fimbriata]
MGGESVPSLESMLERSRGGVKCVEYCESCRKLLKSSSNNVGSEKTMLSLPPGYRFLPHDHELLEFYLKNKVLREPLPSSDRIYDVDFYRYDPDYLTKKFEPWGEETWFFFTHRDRKYKNGKRPNRAAAGVGYWKATGADRPIMSKSANEGDEPIGARKSLVFYEGKPMKGVKTNWIMQEFRIDGLDENTRTRTEHNMRLDDWVLCKIYQKKKRNSASEDDETEPQVKKTPKRRRGFSPKNSSLRSSNRTQITKRTNRNTARSAAPVADHAAVKPLSLPICVEQFLNPEPVSVFDYEHFNNVTTTEMHNGFSRFDFPLLPMTSTETHESYLNTFPSFTGSAAGPQNVNTTLVPTLLRANMADYGTYPRVVRSNLGNINAGYYTHTGQKGFGVSNPEKEPLDDEMNDGDMNFYYPS